MHMQSSTAAATPAISTTSTQSVTPRRASRSTLRTIKTALETANRVWSTKGKAGARTYSIAKWALVDLTRIARPDLFTLRHETRVAAMPMSDVADSDIRETICYWRGLGYDAKLVERRLLAFRMMGFKITDRHFQLAFNRAPFGRPAPAESRH